MRRWLPILVVAAAAVPLALADDPAPAPPAADRVRQIQRNYKLIEVLVQGGLRLADEDDPLKRAQQCNGVAERLASELWQAAERRESARVVELGDHLHALLVQGVVANLDHARRRRPLASALDKDLQRIRDQATQLVQPLEEELQRAADGEDRGQIRHTLRVLQDSRTAVEKAVSDPADDRDTAGKKN